MRAKEFIEVVRLELAKRWGELKDAEDLSSQDKMFRDCVDFIVHDVELAAAQENQLRWLLEEMCAARDEFLEATVRTHRVMFVVQRSLALQIATYVHSCR